MKHLISLAVIASLLCAVGFLQAAPRGSGTEGTISAVGTQGFEMTTEDGKIFDVLCNASTKFMDGKDAATGAIVVVGAHIRVQGGISGDKEIMATTVTVIPSRKKK